MGTKFSKARSVYGPSIVNKQGLLQSLLAFFGPNLVLRFQLVNKRCYSVLIPSLLPTVLPQKLLRFEAGLLEELLQTKSSDKEFKYIFSTTINNLKGEYVGECDLEGRPSGIGIFITS